MPGARVTAFNDEHAVVEVPHDCTLAIGDRVRLRPSHTDPTVNLHDVFYAVEGDRVVDVWPIAARGYPEHRALWALGSRLLACSDVALFLAAVFGVGVLSGATASVLGFGIGSMLTPLLTAPLGASLAVAAVSLPHAVATAVRCWRLRTARRPGRAAAFRAA